MPKVLVLGVGQVGTFACRAISEAGAAVVAADLSPAPGFFFRFGPVQEVDLVTADIRDAAAVSALIQTHAPDTIVLCAGIVGEACAHDPGAAWRINVDGATQVAHAALANGVGRLVFISSLSVYGRPSVDRIGEALPLQPQYEYGRTKAAAERALTSLRAEGLDVRILRPCGIYGPLRLGLGSHSARFIETVLFGAAKGFPSTIRSSPGSSDEYLYVKDLAQAIALAALRDIDSPDFVFNVGTGRKTTAEALRLALQRVVPGARVEIAPDDGERTHSMPPLDVSRIKKVFDFEPRYGLVEGLDDYLQEVGWRS